MRCGPGAAAWRADARGQGRAPPAPAMLRAPTHSTAAGRRIRAPSSALSLQHTTLTKLNPDKTKPQRNKPKPYPMTQRPGALQGRPHPPRPPDRLLLNHAGRARAEVRALGPGPGLAAFPALGLAAGMRGVCALPFAWPAARGVRVSALKAPLWAWAAGRCPLPPAATGDAITQLPKPLSHPPQTARPTARKPPPHPPPNRPQPPPRSAITYPSLQPLPADFLDTMENYAQEAPREGAPPKSKVSGGRRGTAGCSFCRGAGALARWRLAGRSSAPPPAGGGRGARLCSSRRYWDGQKENPERPQTARAPPQRRPSPRPPPRRRRRRGTRSWSRPPSPGPSRRRRRPPSGPPRRRRRPRPWSRRSRPPSRR